MSDVPPNGRLRRLFVCDECVRALAVVGTKRGYGLDANVNVIARHPELGMDCALCERGPGVHPAESFVALVVQRRHQGGRQ